MPAATTAYHRSLKDARRVAESFRASTKSVNAKLLGERLAALADGELPEDTGGTHTRDYIAAIMEVAAELKPEDRHDARAFATAFVNKDAAYSRTRAGIAAIQLEAWIIENGGTLYAQFVETVLDSGDSKFLAVFEGRLTDSDKDRLRSGTQAFVKIEPIAEAGAVNYDAAEVLEFSMFDCTAQGKLDKNVQPKDATQYEQHGRFDTPTFAHESVLPKTRDEYDRVYESGGVGQAAAIYLFGEKRVRGASVFEGSLSFLDDNGTRWLSETGATWLPDVDSIPEADEETTDQDEEPEEEPTADESSEVPPYELNERTSALRSLLDTWAVFRSAVIVEGVETPRTIVVTGRTAYVVPHRLTQVRAIMDEAARAYTDADDLIDLDARILETLQALVRDDGQLCENSAEVAAVVLPEAEDTKDDEPEDDEEDEPEKPDKAKKPPFGKKPKEGEPANPP